MTLLNLRWMVFAALLLLEPALLAQKQSAVIRGKVTGADGQPAVGASVSLLDQLGSPVVVAVTGDGGRFRLDDVAPGTYTLRAEAPPQRSDPRIVTVQGALPLEIRLTLAARITESVTVHEPREAPPVTTRMTIAGEALRQAPARLPGRAVLDALATLPGWAGENDGLLHVRGVDDGVLYVEDGVPVYDRLDTLFGIAPDPAGIGSMNVLTGYIPPEYGLKSGAVVEVQSSTAPRAGWTVNADSAAGSDAFRSARAFGGGPVGDRMTLGMGASAERSDRFLDPVHPDNLHNRGGALSGGAHLTLLASDSDLVKINAGAGRSRYDVPHGSMEEDAGQDQRQRVLQDSQSGSWQRFWSEAVVSHVAMYRRHLDAELWDSPQDTPLSASSARQHDRLGILAGLTYHRGRHTLKSGFEAARLGLHEDFTFAVTDPEAAEAAGISQGAAGFTLARPFRFGDRVGRSQWAFYAQDRLRAADRFTIDFGLRLDRTRLLVPASQWSPRVGLAYSWPRRTTLRASLNRFYQPPQPEHLLLSSSPAARALSPFADGDDAAGTGGAVIEPERQTAWEIGVEQWLAGTVRLDAAYWSRHVRNYADPNIFFGTTIVFPNSVASGHARGLDVRLEMPRYHGWSSYLSYTLSKVEQVGPINGGLFLEDNLREIGPGIRFTPDHDQRHVAAAGLMYQSVVPGVSASLGMRYASGTPLEVEDDDLAGLMERPGAALVDFDAGRVRPRMLFDLMVWQRLYRGPKGEASLCVAILNLANRDYALNFGNPFSGTHFGAPRSVRAELRIGLE